MKNTLKGVLITCFTVFLVFAIAGCSESSTASKNTENIASLAQQATKKENQWEYLVVTFGKTKFSSIEENIKSGASKLVAFQEFANLLSGYEGIDLQLKLDIIGRFGWELVDSIGSIGGDQQLIMKRVRIDNRMKIEQHAIKKLAIILREESAKKEESLQKFLAELKELRSKQETFPEDGLIELDAKEIKDREKIARIKAEQEIKKMFHDPPQSYLEKTKITSVNVNVKTDEDKKGKMLFSGDIIISVDASEALLFDKNKYRATEAQKLKEKFTKLLFQQTSITPVSSLSDFNISIRMQITYAGKTTTVASEYGSIKVKGYQGYWELR